MKYTLESNLLSEIKRFNQLIESKIGNVKPLITEDTQAQDMIDKMNSMVELGQIKSNPILEKAILDFQTGKIKRNEKIMETIKRCVTSKNLKSLIVLTSSVGAFALALISAILAAGEFALMFSLVGTIILIISLIPNEKGESNAGDVEELIMCVRNKKIK